MFSIAIMSLLEALGFPALFGQGVLPSIGDFGDKMKERYESLRDEDVGNWLRDVLANFSPPCSAASPSADLYFVRGLTSSEITGCDFCPIGA